MVDRSLFGFDFEPFREVRRIQDEMNRLMSGVDSRGAAAASPRVNLYAGDQGIFVTAELPGLTAGDIDLTVREDTLTIEGAFVRNAEEEDAVWHRHERPAGRFSRVIRLPFRVDPDQVRARFENGELAVELARPETDRPRKISIRAA